MVKRCDLVLNDAIYFLKSQQLRGLPFAICLLSFLALMSRVAQSLERQRIATKQDSSQNDAI